jgi:hypothetical protein
MLPVATLEAEWRFRISGLADNLSLRISAGVNKGG